ncbi:MAG: cytochrome c [Sneathiella sp.]|nr:cytochrome c [Sneathiella sp.]
MIKRVFFSLLVLGLVGGTVFYILTQPEQITVASIPEHQVDLSNGEQMFWAGGCSSCHAAPGVKGPDKLILSGGVTLDTPFGVFRVPNISPDKKAGIGSWQLVDFLNAMRKGVSPEGEHYYPAFPYTNYQRMPVEDLIDLKAYLDSLPATRNDVPDHDLTFPFTIRRGLGLWKLFYLDQQPYSYSQSRKGAIERGRYLVEGPGHCSACHTARDLFGGEVIAAKYAGAPSFEVKQGENSGSVPNITPHEDGLARWSERDIIFAFETGMTPEYDSFGGSMVAVQNNLSKLSPEDRVAMAAYLKSLPPIASIKP